MLDPKRKEQAEQCVRDCGAVRWNWIDPASIRVVHAFRASCEMNQCGRYGACWSCPPAIPDVETLRKRMLGYQAGLVFQSDTPVSDDFDYEAMEAGALAFYGRCRCAENRLEESGFRPLVLGAGSCRECRRCTYPDAPCVRPQGPVYSLEAFGVDVLALCESAHLPYRMQAGVVPYTGLALLDPAAG